MDLPSTVTEIQLSSRARMTTVNSPGGAVAAVGVATVGVAGVAAALGGFWLAGEGVFWLEVAAGMGAAVVALTGAGRMPEPLAEEVVLPCGEDAPEDCTAVVGGGVCAASRSCSRRR